MIGNIPFSGTELSAIAQKGSPTLLHAVGRAFGLGQAERDALTKGQFPIWFWVTTGIAMGAVAGALIHKKWPHQIDKILKVK